MYIVLYSSLCNNVLVLVGAYLVAQKKVGVEPPLDYLRFF